MRFSILLFLLGPLSLWAQGPFAPEVGISGTKAVFVDSSIFISWASSCTIHRGYIDIASPSLGRVNYGSKEDALGKSDVSVVSLGDSGVAVLSFDGVILDGPGADFAVFENSFGHNFLELAFVEVSKDGKNYQRFPAQFLSDTTIQIGPFAISEPTNLYNLAGKYKAKYGTPFDLNELGIDSVRFVRVVDVVGTIDAKHATRDSKGNKINDPYPTDFANNGLYTGGFDLDALGLIHYEGEKYLGQKEWAQYNTISIYPNPSNGKVWLDLETSAEVQVYDLLGGHAWSGKVNSGTSTINLETLNKGVYVVDIQTETGHHIEKIQIQ